MATRVATCPHCKREVGLINERPMRGSYLRGPRLIRHAEAEGKGGDRGARPLCAKGSGLPVEESDVRVVPDRPSRRRTAVSA